MIERPVILHPVATRATIPPPFTPADIGLPDKFPSWRPEQWHSVEAIVDSPKRFNVICAPTGFGKSLAVMGASLMSGRRGVILTSTKGLQDQYMRDADTIATDIRGLGNYKCLPVIADAMGISRDTPVSDAPCQCGYGCPARPACGYYVHYRAAQESNLVVTNYQCWFYDDLKSGTKRGNIQTGPYPDLDLAEERIGFLVADEAHEIHEELSRFVGLDISRRECLLMKLDWPEAGHNIDWWQQWAMSMLNDPGGVNERIDYEQQRLELQKLKLGGEQWSKKLKDLRDIKRKLDKLSTMTQGGDWVMDEKDIMKNSMLSVRFDPLSPARYAESALWRGVEKVVLVSATVRPKTAELLGIPPDELAFEEYGSTFPPKRRPVILVPSVRMDYRTEQDDSQMIKWLARMDQVIRGRQDRKGIIHAVSYTRAKFIKDNSEFGHLMMIHSSRDRSQVVEDFRRAAAPAILVSPSVDTGYDFHGDTCRYQIIAKLPFASVQDKVVKARQDRDKEYGLYQTAQTVVQMTGRAVRSETDWAETFILDDQARWFIPKVRKFLPHWWLESYRIEDAVPPALIIAE